jgi:hypothetical protein
MADKAAFEAKDVSRGALYNKYLALREQEQDIMSHQERLKNEWNIMDQRFSRFFSTHLNSCSETAETEYSNINSDIINTMRKRKSCEERLNVIHVKRAKTEADMANDMTLSNFNSQVGVPRPLPNE